MKNGKGVVSVWLLGEAFGSTSDPTAVRLFLAERGSVLVATVVSTADDRWLLRRLCEFAAVAVFVVVAAAGVGVVVQVGRGGSVLVEGGPLVPVEGGT